VADAKFNETIPHNNVLSTPKIPYFRLAQENSESLLFCAANYSNMCRKSEQRQLSEDSVFNQAEVLFFSGGQN
jgi:hypothetical protein